MGFFLVIHNPVDQTISMQKAKQLKTSEWCTSFGFHEFKFPEKTCCINRLSGLVQTNQLQILLSKCVELADWQVWIHLNKSEQISSRASTPLHMLQPLVWVSVDGSWEFSPHCSKLQMLCGNEARTEYHSTSFKITIHHTPHDSHLYYRPTASILSTNHTTLLRPKLNDAKSFRSPCLPVVVQLPHPNNIASWRTFIWTNRYQNMCISYLKHM